MSRTPLLLQPTNMARITGGLAIAAGAGTLIGWAFDVETLFRVAAGLAPMKPNTAVCFILCGIALLLRTAQGDPSADVGADSKSSGTRSHWLGIAAATLATLAALIGAATLVEYLAGWNFGLDTWLFNEALHSDGLTPPGRMTPVAALNFVLLGGALALIDFEPGRGFLPAQHAALLVSLTGLIAVLGYLYGLHSLYSVFVYSTMALHTAVTFTLLGLGVMMIRPEKGLMAVATSPHSGGITARRLLPAAVLLPAAIGWLRLQGEMAGWYDGRFGLALFASSNIITFVVLVWFSARNLNRADSRRRRAHVALRAAARELREANERLQDEMAEHRRTEQARQHTELARQRTEHQLHQSQKMESLGTLAGGIAHDFNNILTAIFLNADRARKRLPEDHPVRESLTEISRAGNRAADLVRRIMTFGRQAEPHLKTLRLRAAVEDSLRLLSISLPSNVALVTSLDADAPSVAADATQIHQILLNLGGNALQAMQPQGGTLTVKLDVLRVDASLATQLGVREAGRYVRLAVADTGSGMSKEVLGRIFDPFFTTKEPGEGTGLGLSVVHGIMKLHGGCVTAYSEPGRGALFHLYFPAVKEADFAADAPAPVIPHGNGARVLCVDDDITVLKACADMLEDLGYTVTAFEDPRLAREEFRLQPQAFDLVLTDYTMPGFSGLDLARDLHAVRPDIPIILSSGYMTAAEIASAMDAGIAAFVQKPGLHEELSLILNAALQPRPPTQPKDGARPPEKPTGGT